MRTKALIVLFLFVGVVTAQYRFPPVCYNYAEGQAEAKAKGWPLVVFNACEYRPVYANAVFCATRYTLPGYPEPCIIVTYPGGEMWKTNLSCHATEQEIHAALKAKEVQAQQPDPFRRIAAAPVLRGANC